MGEETGIPENNLLVGDGKDAEKWNCSWYCHVVLAVTSKSVLDNLKQIHQHWIFSKEALSGLAC